MNHWLAGPASAAQNPAVAPPVRLAELVASDLAKWRRVARAARIEMR